MYYAHNSKYIRRNNLTFTLNESKTWLSRKYVKVKVNDRLLFIVTYVICGFSFSPM